MLVLRCTQKLQAPAGAKYLRPNGADFDPAMLHDCPDLEAEFVARARMGGSIAIASAFEGIVDVPMRGGRFKLFAPRFQSSKVRTETDPWQGGARRSP